MRTGGLLCLFLGLVTMVGATRANRGEETREGAEAIGHAVGSYMLPVVFLVAAVVLLVKARKRARKAEREPEP